MTTFLSATGTAPVYLQIHREEKSTGTVFVCRGSFALATHVQLDELVEMFHSEEARRIVLNLSEVKYIDSVGVGTLAMLLKHAMATSRTLVLVAGDGVREILAASSLQDAFQFAPSVEAALA